MKETIKVVSCKDARRWYSNSIGETFERIPDHLEALNQEWKTRDLAGYINFIKFTDGKLV